MSILDKLIKKPAAAPSTTPSTTQTDPVEETKPFTEGLVSTKDIIAPSALEVDFNHLRIDNKYYRTLFVAGYPRFVGINWLSSLINFDASLNIAMYVYPTDGKAILDDLRRKVTEMEAEISTDIQRGRVVNPATQAKLEDALNLQADLVKGEERFFQFGLYITITSDSKEELNRINKNLEAALGSLLIVSKKATLQMEEGFVTTLPACDDKLQITRNMDTTSLATTFPFVSSDLSDDKGIMYGINAHNGSLVIFDRFSMQNYNSVVFATAGAGKSYMIKLEALRSLMLGSEIIVIDPENEYRDLCEAVGGQYIAFGYGEVSKINPFDLSLVEEDGENALNSKVLSLHKLFKVMIGAMDPIEESILDKAIMEAYKAKGVTPDPETQKREPPLIEDLYKALIGMEEQKAQSLAARFEKFIKGSFAGIFNQKTTVNLTNPFVVFGIKNLEDALRPVAMQIILDYIWTVVKATLKRRILVVDEAWYLMQYDDSAEFLRGIVKRGRKYYLGVTTITQDVDDFLKTSYGKEIVTNSAIQILLKQHSAAIDQIGEVFYLSEGEKQLLLSADKGEGIFFAGQNHVAIRVISSDDEHQLITSNPEEVLKIKKTQAQAQDLPKPPVFPPIKESPVVNAQPINNPTPINKPIIETKPEIPMTPPTLVVEKVVEIKMPEIKTQETNNVNPSPVINNPTPVSPTVLQTPASNSGNRPEVVVLDLQQRINELEEKEKIELKEHQEKEEQIKQANQTPVFTKEGELPKYQDIFKTPNPVQTNQLPPLPKLDQPVNNNVILKTETIGNSTNNSQSNNLENKKPIFLNQVEQKIPQPPQLAKKIVPEFVAPTQKTPSQSPTPTSEIKLPPVKAASINPIQTPIAKVETPSTNTDKPKEEKKLNYDDIFGDGIV